MIQHMRILSEISNTHWAMKPESLKGVVSATQYDISEADRNLFHQATKEKREAIATSMGTPSRDNEDVFIRGSVGSFFLDGPIIPRADLFSQMSGMVSIESMTRNLQSLEADPNVESIVIVIDSPGGAVTGTSDFAKLIRNSQKPVYAFGYGCVCSGAYWIGSSVKGLFISDTAELGSIGVVTTYWDDSKQIEESGIQEIEIVSSQSPYKRVDPKTDEGKNEIRSVLDSIAEVFISAVADHRGTTIEDVSENFGQGGTRIGQKAVDLGMADGVTTLEKLFLELDSGENNIFSKINNQPTAKTEDKRTMSKEETQNTQAVDNPTSPSADSKAQVDAAVKAERERIQSIEALMENIKGINQITAAKKVIDAEKFNSEATRASVAEKVLNAVMEAGNTVAQATASSARELSDSAGQVASVAEEEHDAAATPEQSAEDETAKRLLALAKKKSESGKL